MRGSCPGGLRVVEVFAGRFPAVAGTVIRDIVDDDLPRILAINEANVPEVGPLDADRLRFLVEESAIGLSLDQDDALVGFCLVLAPGSTYDSVNYTWFMEHHPSSLYLDRVAFDESARGKGLGRALYGEVDRIMRAGHPSADALTLEVNIDPPNEPSLGFHRALGFVEVGRQMSKGIEVSLMKRDVGR